MYDLQIKKQSDNIHFCYRSTCIYSYSHNQKGNIYTYTIFNALQHAIGHIDIKKSRFLFSNTKEVEFKIKINSQEILIFKEGQFYKFEYEGQFFQCCFGKNYRYETSFLLYSKNELLAYGKKNGIYVKNIKFAFICVFLYLLLYECKTIEYCNEKFYHLALEKETAFINEII